ncbi:efflux RND transporter periplasmic adaptor subunit [Fertoebacter nigrum]|uniref:Efflux RND transporter periplasmic adaptor subunit n=1 Tax=Fertoeibacter niger TaxID=2656921 RepID=A0A8X8H316_9RHOB|nr:efflux RND transporter periplasmic adaptor subunit [Fertoeibacter niger]NUB45287.1 efflux RND transporter periplasmic adaptor subunit [Fertoeibacter niger]
MVKRLIIAIILLGAIVGGIVWFNMFRASMIAQYFATMTPPAQPVAVEEAAPVTWVSGIDAIGTALSAQGVDLAVQAGGLVRQVQFDANDAVAEGQTLVQIDERIEQADLAAARASLELAEAELARNRTLQERGISTATTLESAEAQQKNALAQVARLTAVLEQKELLAPFAGVIGIPQVEEGQYVTPGTVFATLQNLDAMRVDFAVPEQQIARVAPGTSVTASTEVGDLSFTGQIIAIEPRVDPGSRLVTVRAEIKDTNGALYPGQFLRVRVELPAEEGVLAVPQTAISSNLYGDSVFVVRDGEDDTMTVEQVFVQVGRRSGGRAEITEGVAAGDRIVTAGQNRLTSGGPVTIDNSVAPAAALGE